MNQILSLFQLFAEQATTYLNAPAILAPDRMPLPYAGLHQHICQTVGMLNSLGIARNDRVAIVLPNGPEMAVAFLAVAACATAAPLNPAYRAAEFDFYLDDLDAKAVIVTADVESLAREVAIVRNIPIIELLPSPTTAGLFTLRRDPVEQVVSSGFAKPDDVALILHTSGTTSRPKMVPLTHRNICTSASNIAQTLQLTPHDRCLNVMPLFHIHGLMAALLSSMVAGGSVVCTPGFDAPRFFTWLREGQPTWYTAVPTMHQAILARSTIEAERNQQVALRFVRSSSSPLPSTIMTDLEQTFNVPVIEAYGMTEAAHQMASNPLPLLVRKPGSVGLAAGPQVSIMAEQRNTFLATGETGEVVIHGENVTLGYLSNAEANAEAFVDGWFRTGDQGYIDEDGYLFLTGRLKEIINRGGEKIAPREVDEVLLTHPAVEQSLTFAIPDVKLGEEIGVAVVLRDKSVTEADLRHFVADALADFKIPRQVIFLDEIPKGPTGKLQRIGLAEKLGLTGSKAAPVTISKAFVAPRNQTEQALVNIWCDVLAVPNVSVNQPFLDIGGDSMLAAKLIAQIKTEFNLSLSVVDLFDASTIEEQADIVENMFNHRQTRSPNDNRLLRLIQKGNNSNLPIFFVPGGGGGEMEFLIYARLIHLLGAEQPVYGFFARGHDGTQPPHTTVEEMVSDYLQAIHEVQPTGPYLLAGECVGGKVAFELAYHLEAEGQEIAQLLLMNTQLADTSNRPHNAHSAAMLKIKFQHQWSELQKRSVQQQVLYLTKRLKNSRLNPLRALSQKHRKARHVGRVRAHYNRILQSYVPEKDYLGLLILLVSEDYYQCNPTMGFEPRSGKKLNVYPVPGDLHSYLSEHVQTTATQLHNCLAKIQEDIQCS